MHPLHKHNIKEYLTLVDFFFTTWIQSSFFSPELVLFQVEDWHGSNNLCNSHHSVNFVSLALTIVQVPGLKGEQQNYVYQSAASTPQGHHKGIPHTGGIFFFTTNTLVSFHQLVDSSQWKSDMVPIICVIISSFCKFCVFSIDNITSPWRIARRTTELCISVSCIHSTRTS